MLSKYYCISNHKELESFLSAYLPLVDHIAKLYNINLESKNFQADHLGLQALSSKEFEHCHKTLLRYSKLIHDDIIHNRRNRVYEFNTPIKIYQTTIQRIEIFEPKPKADLKKLKPGIEHIAFMVQNYDKFLKKCEQDNVPIDKKLVFTDGSKFFKTSFVNLVEIEFRNDFLGVK